jgi:hypothetical protein
MWPWGLRRRSWLRRRAVLHDEMLPVLRSTTTPDQVVVQVVVVVELTAAIVSVQHLIGSDKGALRAVQNVRDPLSRFGIAPLHVPLFDDRADDSTSDDDLGQFCSPKLVDVGATDNFGVTA